MICPQRAMPLLLRCPCADFPAPNADRQTCAPFALQPAQAAAQPDAVPFTTRAARQPTSAHARCGHHISQSPGHAVSYLTSLAASARRWCTAVPRAEKARAQQRVAAERSERGRDRESGGARTKHCIQVAVAPFGRLSGCSLQCAPSGRCPIGQEVLPAQRLEQWQTDAAQLSSEQRAPPGRWTI